MDDHQQVSRGVLVIKVQRTLRIQRTLRRQTLEGETDREHSWRIHERSRLSD
jgi:hypothetical protein